MAEYTDDVLFGDVWLRKELSPRDRSLITITTLIGSGRSAQLPNHLNRALDNGLQPVEASGVLTHMAVYAGWPLAVASLEVYDRVYAARGIGPISPTPARDSARVPSAPSIRPPVTSGIAAIAPKFAEVTDAVVRQNLWQRTDLAPRDRSLVSISTLVAMGEMDDLSGEIERGRANGLTSAEISETLAHLAFYVGWPRAERAVAIVAAMPVAKR
ncbi:carboxymuconolactone decarboxylase family protein [Novosphingobium sp. SL115]|uniref:carboxymuconolactone decarboxylase family protein n=1 Tax=Novosphingobium sp. SL115 TaxID=2995150 RepID=UPI002275B591|nr:carboxymuconolactone decarboxylase family protein [Novosphingobium sp. SL115]MCY1671976.1 carboxymuconolactone decarboxylase family protein [Novosphingobium sp. SL115]